MRKLDKLSGGIILILGCLLIINTVKGQDIELADEYYQQGEFMKAKELYQKIAKNVSNTHRIHKKYVFVLIATKDFKEGEKYIKRQIKAFPEEPLYRADYGMMLESAGEKKNAEKEYDKLIESILNDSQKINVVGQYFVDNNKIDWAEKLYQAARKNSKEPFSYALQLASIYKLKGNVDKMIDEYLEMGVAIKNSEEYIQNALQDVLTTKEDFDKLRNVLLDKVQKNPNEPLYSNLLIWLLIQQKDFGLAFVQARSIDKRYKLEGVKLIDLGMICMQNESYKDAEKVFDYLVKEYSASPNYPTFRRYLISAKEEQIKKTYPVDEIKIRSLIGDYEKMLSELGKSARTAQSMRSMALLYAFYLQREDTAVAILKNAIELTKSEKNFSDQCKMDLGDIYLLKNEPWESTLLYAQVEKSQKEKPLGYEAKLRNARLSYFRGDFELAQEHLDVLKMATSREIANDAMNLSLLIKDNTGLDSSEAAMKEYAAIELLSFQNRIDEALVKLEGMKSKYQDHSLADEILWLEANLYVKKNDFPKAIENLEKIVKGYKYDILSDDAHFLIATIYEEKLNEKEKAMELYQEHMKNYPGSIYTAEARKRFRILRKDFPN